MESPSESHAVLLNGVKDCPHEEDEKECDEDIYDAFILSKEKFSKVAYWKINDQSQDFSAWNKCTGVQCLPT